MTSTLFAAPFIAIGDLIPFLVFGAFVFGVFAVLSMLSQRNSRAAQRLDRFSRPASLAEIEDPKLTKKERFGGVLELAKSMSAPMMPKSELEQSELKLKLANAGFRSEAAVSVYLGIRFAVFLTFLVVSCLLWFARVGQTVSGEFLFARAFCAVARCTARCTANS